ncbi:uncharacterized protein sS8_4750 [Methylocaldum marinum]|uniref:Uncharacterized protein n=1 Tax=Methylocaldum marinum TaxID=1432792 RepID=A0A250KYB0_9GAMM|nr:uncharacterized protein sS8_4750 [Methylocaldum marinum]
MAEWSKAHDWKSCIRQNRIEGSNPSLSANSEAEGVRQNPENPRVTRLGGFFVGRWSPNQANVAFR